MPARIHLVAALVSALFLNGEMQAQPAGKSTIHVCVKDQQGLAIAGAQIQRIEDPSERGVSDGTGCADLKLIGRAEKITVRVTRQGFDTVTQTTGAVPQLDVVMAVAANHEQVEVTAARTPLPLDASASSVRSMTSQQLQEAPSLTLDERLRQVAGFQLFRRTSSWVANPTTEGTSLRGLGSTAASRTLVLSDQVPLNDAYGGWIHWSETPAMAVRDVELMRGGASDLYGSSAIGGVIDVMTVT